MRRGGRGQSKYPDKQLTVMAARNQMLALVNGCTDAALATLTVDSLERMYRVPRREIEYHLTIARQRRAGEARDV